ncbi:Hypothetical protein D9617_70g089320 [Elsinoe fawcettii]|nr:Hypothetical protein D9617_70g089320 [Elsinoe fawcettii]
MTANASVVDEYDKAQSYHGDSALTLAATAQVAGVLLLLQSIVLSILLVRRRRHKGFAIPLHLAGRAENDITTGAPAHVPLSFVRYILALSRLFGAASILVLPILLPVNSLQPQNSGQARGLDRFSYTNIPPSRSDLLWVHLLLLTLFTLLCCAMIHAELVTQSHRDAAAPTDVPTRFLFGCGAREMTSSEILTFLEKHFPSGISIKPVLIDELQYVDTDALSAILQGIEQCVIAEKDDTRYRPGRLTSQGRPEAAVTEAPKSLIRLLKRLRRTLENASTTTGLPRLFLLEVGSRRDRDFIRTVTIPHQLVMIEALYDVSDVLWSNIVTTLTPTLRPGYFRRQMLKVLPCLAAVCLALPVSFQGLFAYLQEFVATVKRDPDFRLWPSTWLASYLSGVFPQMLALALVYFSPVVIRHLIVLRRCGSTRSRDLSSANYLFTYLFFQVFVFVSFSTTMTAVLSLIVEKPGEVPELFSVNLPKAGNYFISYIIVQGLTLAVTNLLDWKYLLERFIFSRFRAMTMRQQLMMECPSDLDWVILFPTITLLAIIEVAGDGERWREMARDGERWREMARSDEDEDTL